MVFCGLLLLLNKYKWVLIHDIGKQFFLPAEEQVPFSYGPAMRFGYLSHGSLFFFLIVAPFKTWFPLR